MRFWMLALGALLLFPVPSAAQVTVPDGAEGTRGDDEVEIAIGPDGAVTVRYTRLTGC